MQKITPHLWYVNEAEEAAAFYVGVFPGSQVKRVSALPSETPSGPPGSVKVVEFELFGQGFMNADGCGTATACAAFLLPLAILAEVIGE